MKKIAALVVLVLGLFAIPAFASVTDLGTDVYEGKWMAEWRGSDISRNGIAYEVITIVIDTRNLTTEGRAYYNISSTVTMLGYLRYVDCSNKKFASVRTMHWDINGKVLFDSGIATEWNWYPIDNPKTMMGAVLQMFCGVRS